MSELRPQLAPTRPGARMSAYLAGRGAEALVLLNSLLITGYALVWSYYAKVACGGPPFGADGRSHHWPVGNPDSAIPCYSDIMFLWVGRDINNHVFPYVNGGIDASGHLFGGSVEYPVLSGMMMWLGAIGAHTDTAFFTHTVWLLVPFALAITIMLALMTRWWVLLWAATGPLVLYAFHNWELPVVFTSVAAVAVMVWGSTISPTSGERRMSLRTSAILASILLALGFCLKLYPGFFVLPLAAYVLTAGSSPARRALDWVGAAWVMATAAITVILVQLPFMIAGFDGWKAAMTFQGKRRAEVDTNSIWHWGFRFIVGRNNIDTYNTLVGILSPLLILGAWCVAMYLGWRVYQRRGIFPWVGVAAAMLAGFMVFHKVNSPQYVLWLLPFFVLLQIRWQVVAAYIIANGILDMTIFRLFGIMNSGAEMKWWVIGGVNFGVWVQSILLVYLIYAFVVAGFREPLASMILRPKPIELADADLTDDALARA
ncbi:hypothetical protein GOEFS_092_00930 [Gordonia effusa NBRC 100432]|uniref:DUF2029 domain-containing protein n=1 Tax=Gordonia effusa NBRC 100432 TaxID=1077974 RepID=H0R3L7_9ACTN|nr:hypothetical protein [Gordonia effusa]GAB19668.1 hypothetical protein GOEFS_092_00930 [Gordonia effusa NBRC 100432]